MAALAASLVSNAALDAVLLTPLILGFVALAAVCWVFWRAARRDRGRS